MSRWMGYLASLVVSEACTNDMKFYTISLINKTELHAV